MGVVNVGGGECQGGECRTIDFQQINSEDFLIFIKKSRFSEKFLIFKKISDLWFFLDFWRIFRFSVNFQIFGEFSDFQIFGKIFRDFGEKKIFRRKKFRILENFPDMRLDT